MFDRKMDDVYFIYKDNVIIRILFFYNCPDYFKSKQSRGYSNWIGSIDF